MDEMNRNCLSCANYERCSECFAELPMFACKSYQPARAGRKLTPEQKQKSGTSTLCFECSRLDCSWMKKLQPIEGWEAVKTDVGHKSGGRYIPLPSYRVKSCPEFSPSNNPEPKPIRRKKKK